MGNANLWREYCAAEIPSLNIANNESIIMNLGTLIIIIINIAIYRAPPTLWKTKAVKLQKFEPLHPPHDLLMLLIIEYY
jgi:hypothetical protein